MLNVTETLRSRAEKLPWHHQIDLGQGVLTPGNVSIEILKAQAVIYFRDGLNGRTVLDVGCWDGFNSFEAERRGAAQVLATDHFVWSEKCWGNRASFELAREAFGSKVQVRDIDLPELSVESVGHFDIVLFLGVFYHLRNPFGALEQIAPIATHSIVVETQMDATDNPRPAMIFYPGSECGGDPTNWWGPNQPCVEAMLRDLGFPRVEFTPHPTQTDRGIFHGYRAAT